MELNKNLQFSKYEYDYFMEYCGFTEEEKEVFELRRDGYNIVEISVKINKSVSTVNRLIKRVKYKIAYVISHRPD